MVWHIIVSNNKHKNRPSIIFNKAGKFYYSVYRPDPSHKSEYNRYKRNMLLVYYGMVLDGNSVATICLVNKIIHSHYHIISNASNLGFFIKTSISGNHYEIIRQLIATISDQKVLISAEEKNEKYLQEINDKIDDKIRFITKDNEMDINHIFIDAYCYVHDNKYDKEILRRDTLVELYERKIVEPNSKLSHNLMRNAAKSGILWIVKFLIEKGCPVRNLPEYGSFKHQLESKQLKDILQEKVTDYSKYGKEWVCERTIARQNVLNYLVENNYL